VLCVNDMEPDWKANALEAAARKSSEQEERFLWLVDKAAWDVDIAIAKVLIMTCSAIPDFGTQERVESVLVTAEPEVVAKAVL